MASGVPAGRLSIEIVAEIARLQQDLDKAKRAVNAASKDIAASAKYANDNLATMGTGINKVGVSSKHAAFGMRNLAFQAQDLGVQFAMAANSSDPLKGVLMALVMQGPQIKNAMDDAGMSVWGLTKHVGGLAGRFAPLLIAIGAASGAMWAWLETVNAEKKGELDAYAASLGLTKEEIEKAGGAAVTAGDMILGLWDVIKQALELEQVFADLKEWIMSMFRDIAANAKKNISEIYAAIYTIDDALKYAGDHGGEVFAEGIINGLNAAIDAINSFGTIKGPNNEVFWSPNISRIKNSYAGAGKAAAESVVASYQKHLKAAGSQFDSALSAWSDAGFKRATGRLDKALKDRKGEAGKAGKAAGDEFAKELAKALERLADDVNKAFGALWKRTKEIQAQRLEEDYERAFEQIRRDQAARTKPMEDAAAATAEWNEQLDRTIDFLDLIGGKASKIGDIAALMKGMSSGDFSGVPGPLGAIMQSVGNTAYSRTNPETGQREIRLLREDMADWLGQDGTVIKALQGAGLGVAGAQMIFGAGNTNVGAAFGGAIGKGFGKDIGNAVAKGIGGEFGKLAGQFAGAIAPVIGGILGNMVGKLLKSTPRGSATFNEQGLVSTRGNSDSRIAAATKLGGGVLDVLNQLAEQLGAGIGSASFSVGMRKKNFVLDPSGQGRTKGAGVLNFGQDEEAALKAAIQDAISDGVFTGLSDGVQRLLNGEGDIEKQLQKALSLKGAMDSLAQRKDGQAFDLAALDKEFAKLRDIATEAGEGLAQVEELYGLKRKDIVDKHAAEALDRAREALEQENALSSMRVTLLELQGKSAEALALSRQIELSTMTEAEKVIQRQIHAEQDLAKVRDEAAAATEAAAAKWQSNYQIALGLTGRLLELDGDVEALRARELQQIPEHLRYLQELIWAREDEAKATEAATKAAEELAAKHKAIADERYGLETQWLQAIGNEAELRKRALALLDPSNRAIQQQIWAYEDAQKAAQAEIEARNQQIASIRSTIDALSGAQAKWMEFAANIREFRAGLFSPDKGSGLSVQQARADFDRTAKMAAFGDEKALQSFTGVSQTFLDAARSSARTQLDYQRAIGLVAGAADAAAKGADGVGAQAANEYAALQAQITQLEALNEQTTATVAALAGVGDVQENEVVPTLENVVDQLKANGKDAMAIAKDRQAAEVSTVSRLEAVETLLARLLQHLQEETTAVTTSNTPATPIYVDQVP